MADRVSVPRASLAVTVLDDLDYITLCQTANGQRAFALFCALLAAAKNLDNGGAFNGPLPVLAMTVRWNQDDFKFALETLLEMGGRWVVGTLEAFTLRSFAKWNKGWGGARKGAGKPPSQRPAVPASHSSCNQVPQLDSTTASASASASGTAKTTTSRKRGRELVDPASAEIPDDLMAHERHIREFATWRRESLRKPILAGSWQRFIGECRKLGANLPASIAQSIANGWQGLFQPKGAAHTQPAPSYDFVDGVPQ